eukprot:Sro2702_g335140.2  (273) ;mRNA; r:10787-11605
MREWDTLCPSEAPTASPQNDNHNCVATAGYTWCPTTQTCVREWDTPCPSEAPTASPQNDNHNCVATAGYSWCSTLNTCVREWVTPCPSEAPTASPHNDNHNCVATAGYTWCAATNSCMRNWGADCPDASNVGTTAMGGNAQAVGGVDVASEEGVTATAMSGSGPDEHGCVSDAGYTWCPKLAKCIRPFLEDCPVEGTQFEGPISIQCIDGACSINDDCQISMGNFTIGGPYLNGLDGNLTIPSGCTGNCTGCQEHKQENGAGVRRLRGSFAH